MMRALLTIFLLGVMFASPAWAQPPDGPPGPPPEGLPGKRIADRMAMFIERKMQLKEQERKEFTPIFLRYEKEYRETLRSNREDRLLLQQQLIALQLRYRSGKPKSDRDLRPAAILYSNPS
ncbi:MAG: periplasmic heavy metal sensor [Chitinophagia bacterium]|nr:periplasmic heavy metal sensor [Chitinophagia bacterium]